MWSQKDDRFEKVGEILFGKNLQEAMQITTIGKKHLLLVVGGYDSNIHCYTCLRGSGDFVYKFSLTGHLNSIKDFSFTSQKFVLPDDTFYLATCSQDNYIRLWKLQPLANIQQTDNIDQYQSKTSYILDLKDTDEQIWNVALDSVLIQHQEAVSSVEWALKDTKIPAQGINDLCLLSSSFDFTVCVWHCDDESNQWSVTSTLGAMSGNKHAYFGAKFLDGLSKDERIIFAYTYGGAVHIWANQVENQWVPKTTIKGHFGEVTDLDWDSSKQCLVTCSLD